MNLGRERSLIIRNPIKRAIIGLVGDIHFGRLLRFLYLKQVLKELGPNPSSILDAGCGKGYASLYFARQFPSARVVGVDLDKASLAEGDLLRRASQLKNLTFRQHDLQKPLGEREVDLAISWEVIQYVPDDNAMLANLHAVLRSGGICLVHVMHAVGAYRRIGARRVMNLDANVWPDGAVRPGYTEDEFERKLRKAGFTRFRLLPTFGLIGMTAHSYFEVVRNWPRPFYFILYPFLLMLGYVDVLTPKRYHGAILAMAWKD
jgi:SAM-dependent methyltransferase